MVIGRQEELDVLGAQLEEARAGRGGTVVLVGEAGIGKSRLARELLGRATEAGVPSAVGRATPSGSAGAYRPLTEALLQLLRLAPILDDPAIAAWRPALAGLIPVPGADPASEVSAAVRGEAVIQLLARLAQPHGLVLVLEDLHWADPDTVALVEYVADNGGHHGVLTLLTVRSGEPSATLDLVRRQRGRPGVIQLELARLEPGAVLEMVRACSQDASNAVVERIERSADGVPLLVEELLASPGVPTSFVESVVERLTHFDQDGRRILEAAAVLGRHFDWRLLTPTTGLPADRVTAVLSLAVERLLLQVDGGKFRFRHALTRDAVLNQTLPPRQVELAHAALAAVRSLHPDLEGQWRDLAADLARQAGDLAESAGLLTAIGQEALIKGALGTAIDTLQRAAAQAPTRADTALLLVEALGLAGRVDDAVRVTRAFAAETPGDRGRIHLRLAQAAVAADRWTMASDHIGAARQALTDEADPASEPALLVLEAEVALAAGDLDRARRRAESALSATSDPAVRCQALEVLGRVTRLTDVAAARTYFERARTEAETSQLAVWRVRALHELGTIDMFDRAATETLVQARQGALDLGALSTAAVVDLQLAATSICRWEPAAGLRYGRSSLELAEALRLDDVRQKALLFMAEASAIQGDLESVEYYLAASGALTRTGTQLEAFAWGMRGEAALALGDLDSAGRSFDTGSDILTAHPHAEPATFRAVRLVLLAAGRDRRTRGEIDLARRHGVGSFALNRGLMGYAEALLAGAGDARRAAAIAAEADHQFVNTVTWRTLARAIAAPVTRGQGWGSPDVWLQDGITTFGELDLPGLVELCRHSLTASAPDRLERAGVTSRERDVLELVRRGLANKEIAQNLGVSARTVEKHIESLLRKTDSRSRTQLAVWAADYSGQPPSHSR